MREQWDAGLFGGRYGRCFGAGIAGARAGCVASLRFQHAEQQSGGEPCTERAAQNRSGFDLPIAVGLLCATGQVNPAVLDGVLFAGELSLEGAVRPIAGLLAYALCAQRQDLALVSAAEDGAGRIEGIRRRAIESLGQLRRGEFAELGGAFAPEKPQELDFRDIAGHDMAKRAFQIAAAGGHGLLMMGPPGSGKTMLASRLPSILAPLVALGGT